MSYADALTREAAWLRADLAPTLPPVLAGIGDGSGPFGVVEAYPRTVAQQPHQLYVCRDPYTEAVMDAAGVWREGNHGIALLVLWAKAAATQAHLVQQELDNALERVVDRVRGLAGDLSHGGRFLRAGAGAGGLRVEYPDARTLDQAADAPFGAGNAYVVLVRYVVTDAVAA